MSALFCQVKPWFNSEWFRATWDSIDAFLSFSTLFRAQLLQDQWVALLARVCRLPLDSVGLRSGRRPRVRLRKCYTTWWQDCSRSPDHRNSWRIVGICLYIMDRFGTWFLARPTRSSLPKDPDYFAYNLKFTIQNLHSWNWFAPLYSFGFLVWIHSRISPWGILKNRGKRSTQLSWFQLYLPKDQPRPNYGLSARLFYLFCNP